MKRKLIVYLSALLVLVLGYVAVTKLPKKTAEEEKTEYYPLENFMACSLRVENSYGEYTLTKEQDKWMINNKKADSRYINQLQGIGSSLKLDANELDKFGLKEPLARVTLKNEAGEEKTLLLGDLTSDKIGRYVLLGDVYVADASEVEWLLSSKTIFNDRILLNEASPKKVEFNGICLETVDDVWQMTSPYRHSVRGAELQADVLEKLMIEAVEFTDKTKAECGLEEPKGYVSVWNEKGEKGTVYFGDRKEGLIYAVKENEDEICLIKIPDFLDKKPIYFLNKLCYVKPINEIKSIKVNDISFEIAEDKYTKDEKNISKEAFTEFYKKLMGMTLVDEAVSPGKEKLLLKMTVDFKNGAKDTVEVYQYKERYGAVFINGSCTFYILKEAAEEISEAAKNL